MVKAYQRYVPGENGGRIGVVCSPACSDVSFVDDRGAVALTASLDALTLWNLKTGALVATLRDDTVASPSAVTTLAPSPGGGRLIAAGHADGSVRLWDRASLSLGVTLEGHKAPVQCLAWQPDGTCVASGGLDTDIIVWDAVQEAGLFRLRGHKDAITCVVYVRVGASEHLVSGSKDGLCKVWDTALQSCLHTLSGHRGEVWGVAYDPVSSTFVSGGQDTTMRVWSFRHSEPSFCGEVPKNSKARVGTLAFADGGGHLACHTADRSVQIFRVRTKEEALGKMRRRLKRKRDAGEEVDGVGDKREGGEAGGGANHPSAGDQFEAVCTMSGSSKIRGISLFRPVGAKPGTPLKVLCALSTNALELHSVSARRGDEAPKLLSSLHSPAHRGDVRALAVSEQEGIVVACAGDELKSWSLETQQCLQTVETKGGVCSVFLPGDRYVAVGGKSGDLQVVDLASSSVVETLEGAHEGALWGLAMHPSGKAVMSAGADKTMKVWSLGVVEREEGGGKRVCLVGQNSIEMEDDVMAISISNCGKFIALALLDTTVRILHADSYKHALSLYGHRLPVLALDISSDSTLCATGSADKNLKIWGLDFGDCHKSMHAHADSVMAVKFVPRTHYCWTGGKDGVIKMWDCDKLVQITSLKAHLNAPVWSLSVSQTGGMLLSGGGDRAVRVWERSKEQMFVEEERQNELNELLEQETDAHHRANPALQEGEVDQGAPVADQGARGARDGADRILEALELCALPADSVQRRLLPKPANLMLLGTLSAIRPHLLRPAVASLPFVAVTKLLEQLAPLSGVGGVCQKVSGVVNVVVREHGARLAGERAGLLRKIGRESRKALTADADRMGVNLAGLRSCCRALKEKEAEEGPVGEQDDNGTAA